MSHSKLLDTFSLSKGVLSLYAHEMDLSGLSYVSLRETHAYPPCFIPLFEYGTAPSYRGLVRHFFVNRAVTFVNLIAHRGFHINEYARSEEQFTVLMFIDLIEYEEEWNDMVEQAARVLEIKDARSVFDLWVEKEDGCFLELPQFESARPYSPMFYNSDYDGDFPNANMDFSSISTFCSVELEQFRNRIGIADSPPWMQADSQRPIFNKLLEEGDLAGCWMSLNSRGWEWGDMRAAVEELASIETNEVFQLQCSEWLSHNHESFSTHF